jgi:hypothetical protein
MRPTKAPTYRLDRRAGRAIQDCPAGSRRTGSTALFLRFAHTNDNSRDGVHAFRGHRYACMRTKMPDSDSVTEILSRAGDTIAAGSYVHAYGERSLRTHHGGEHDPVSGSRKRRCGRLRHRQHRGEKGHGGGGQGQRARKCAIAGDWAHTGYLDCPACRIRHGGIRVWMQETGGRDWLGVSSPPVPRLGRQLHRRAVFVPRWSGALYSPGFPPSRE